MTTMALPRRSFGVHRRTRGLGPNWFTVVMGTGIVANAAAGLPLGFPGRRAAATGVWSLAAVLLIALITVSVVHRDRFRAYALDPAMAPFFGAPPMAMMTVGAGALLTGRDVVGLPAALAIDAVLWTAGTLTGLAGAVAVPCLMAARHPRGAGEPSPTWLMPVVPPMVSAATGALLVPHLPAGTPRHALLAGCAAMFALSLAASVLIIRLVCRRLTAITAGPARLIPTLWIVLGPLGQSITAACLLSGGLPEPYGTAAVLYSVPVGAFALAWFCLAAAVTIRTARAGGGLPFALTWWAFTFPVGTCVTGLSALAARTGAVPLRWWAAVLFALLVLAWITVGARTVRAVGRGELTAPGHAASVGA